MKWISLFLIAFALLINGCSVTEPPAQTQIETVFQTYREEFQTVKDYLLSQEPPVSIYDTREALPEPVMQAVETLMRKAGCSSIHYSENAIHFVLWTRFTDAGCGIAYSEAKNLQALDVDFPYLTREQPLSEQGWFYYVEDYAQWRNEKSN